MEYYWALSQGIFYFITGIWPLISMRTFEKVSGPKTDHWLVKTVGALLCVAAAALITGFARREINPELAITGAGCALVLLLIDLNYVAKKVISKVYLLDAAAELTLLAGWLFFYFL